MHMSARPCLGLPHIVTLIPEAEKLAMAARMAALAISAAKGPGSAGDMQLLDLTADVFRPQYLLQVWDSPVLGAWVHRLRRDHKNQ